MNKFLIFMLLSFSSLSFSITGSQDTIEIYDFNLETLNNIHSVYFDVDHYDSGHYRGGFFSSNSFYIAIRVCLSYESIVTPGTRIHCGVDALKQSPVTNTPYREVAYPSTTGVYSLSRLEIMSALNAKIRTLGLNPYTARNVDYWIRVDLYESNYINDDESLGHYNISANDIKGYDSDRDFVIYGRNTDASAYVEFRVNEN